MKYENEFEIKMANDAISMDIILTSTSIMFHYLNSCLKINSTLACPSESRLYFGWENVDIFYGEKFQDA